MDADFDECAAAIGQGQTVYLEHKGAGDAGVARRLDDGTSYELVMDAIPVTRIAQSSRPGSRAHKYPSREPKPLRFDTLDELMATVKVEYQGWSTNRDDL